MPPGGYQTILSTSFTTFKTQDVFVAATVAGRPIGAGPNWPGIANCRIDLATNNGIILAYDTSGFDFLRTQSWNESFTNVPAGTHYLAIQCTIEGPTNWEYRFRSLQAWGVG
jgi:hypothetical protein